MSNNMSNSQGSPTLNNTFNKALNHKPCMELKSSWINRLFFWWTNQLITEGNQKSLEASDLIDMRPDETYRYAERFIKNFMKEHKNDKNPPRITNAIWAMIKWVMIKSFIYMIISSLLQFSGPLLVKQILLYLSDDTMPIYIGYIYASIMTLCFFVRAILFQFGAYFSVRYSFQAINGFYVAIFEKILKIKTSVRKFADPGKMTNLVTIDTNQIFLFCTFIPYVIAVPFIVIVALILIFIEIGFIGLIGPLILFTGTYLQTKVQKKLFMVRGEAMKYNDQRSKALTEYINGIRIIKYYGWENIVMKTIAAIRSFENKLIFKSAIIRSLVELLSTCIPIFISISVFGVYVALGNTLTPAIAYTILSLFNLLQGPLKLFAMVLVLATNAKVSLVRIQHFMEYEETEAKTIYDETLPIGTIFIKDGEFSWDTYSSKVHADLLTELTIPKSQKVPTAPAAAGSKFQILDEINTSLLESSTILKNINLIIQPNEFISIIGQVGSGKTSLLHAILGEMTKTFGEIKINGKIGYISQQPWLRNASLKDNILFGLPYDEQKYERILDICELRADIAILPGHDQVEIGERGINLSGGQKQRVAIARAVYANCDIYLIDDCLSALDAHVGKKIFDNVLRGELKGKTIVFVTHAIYYALEANKIFVMKEGQIVESGLPQELKQKKDSEFNKITININKEEVVKEQIRDPQEELDEVFDNLKLDEDVNQIDIANATTTNTSVSKPKSPQKANLSKGRLIIKEKKAEGVIPWSVYRYYFSSGGLFCTWIAALLFIIAQILRILNDWWVGIWSSGTFNLTQGYYVLGFFILSIGTGLIVIIRGIAYAYFAKESSTNLQKKLLSSILKSPISWFDVTPTGRILNRANKDQDDIDQSLPWIMQYCVQTVLQIIATCILIGLITPLFFILDFIIFVLFYYSMRYYLNASRETKRIEATNKSPMISLISEGANGTIIIRAFRQEQAYLDQFDESVDNLNRTGINVSFCQRWISIRTEILATLIIGGASLFGVLARQCNYSSSNTDFIGLSITWALTIAFLVSFVVNIVADTELQMNSVQRIMEYINKAESEADFTNPSPSKQYWPTAGICSAKNIAYQYREDLPLVLKNISFSIKNHEKIGVVGRTGSGKSTLTLGLLRILELTTNEDGSKGQIIIDDLDISKLGLHHLRHNVTIIPQDPTLFAGTIRSNLDPFNEYNDNQIISALKKVQIWENLKPIEDEQTQFKTQANIKIEEEVVVEKVNKDKDYKILEIIPIQAIEIEISKEIENKRRLDMKIDEAGSNLSLGQRQLLCMARALLRKTKILIMDEATASIDELTDYLIQKMIKTEFKDTTVITIAHRLNTIIQYDRILVLDNGKIAEFDTPIALISTPNSYFANLIKEHGHEFVEKMRYLAMNKDIEV